MSKMMDQMDQKNQEIRDVSEPSLEPTGETAASIGLFRIAMHSIAERETARPVPSDWLIPARQRQRRAQRRVVLAWACAAALCVAVVPRATHHPHDVSHNGAAAPPAAVAQTEESYTALLEQVDNEVSAPVPDSLAPLTELDSWNSNSSNLSTEKKNVTQ
jgi:hypothetical protein